MFAYLQWIANQELEDRQTEINDQFLRFQEKEEAMQKEVDELQHAN